MAGPSTLNQRIQSGNHRDWRHWSLAGLGLLLPLCLGLARANRWPLTGDEALYAYWARHWLEHRDPLFLAHWIDKPPVYLWLQSLALYTFGPTSASARYVNILAAALLCLGLGRFAGRQWGWKSAGLCCVLIGANPLILAYGPTGLTDPILVLAGTAACLLAVQQRYRASGVALGLSIFCKQTGLLYLPLVVGMVWICQSDSWRQDIRLWVRGLLSISLPILIWDGMRMMWAPSFWYAGFDHYAPLRIISGVDLGPRLAAWLPLYSAALGGGLGWAAWGALLLAAGWVRRQTPLTREDCWISLSLIWAVGYALLHWLLTFNPWIRYLLPLTPILVLSTIWAWKTLWSAAQSPWHRLCLGLLLLGMLLSVASGWHDGWHGMLPGMQDNPGVAGLPEALARLLSAAPHDSVILHRELSWHFLFYLFDHPAPARVWFADAAHLVELVAKQPVGTPIFQLRLTRDSDQTIEIAAALQEAGYHPVLCFQEAEVGVYEILSVHATTCLSVQLP